MTNRWKLHLPQPMVKVPSGFFWGRLGVFWETEATETPGLNSDGFHYLALWAWLAAHFATVSIHFPLKNRHRNSWPALRIIENNGRLSALKKIQLCPDEGIVQCYVIVLNSKWWHENYFPWVSYVLLLNNRTFLIWNNWGDSDKSELWDIAKILLLSN